MYTSRARARRPIPLFPSHLGVLGVLAFTPSSYPSCDSAGALAVRQQESRTLAPKKRGLAPTLGRLAPAMRGPAPAMRGPVAHSRRPAPALSDAAPTRRPL